jgi:hypothetical protein
MSSEFQQEDERFIARAKQLLDQSVAGIDHPTVLRLQRARHAACAAGPARGWWILWTKQPALENHHAPVLEDMDLVMSAENIELAEDLEFYHWLADDDAKG